MTIEQAKKLDNFLCSHCAKEDGTGSGQGSLLSNRDADSSAELYQGMQRLVSL
jgi:hypothetical protein